jgi:hypothetical protein
MELAKRLLGFDEMSSRIFMNVDVFDLDLPL